MLGTTLAYESFGSFGLSVHTKKNPSDEDWKQYLAVYGADLRRCSEFRLLVWTDGGNLSAAQRRQLAEAVPDDRSKVAVITESNLVRGTITALGWLMSLRISAHGPNNINEAMTKLGLNAAEQQKISEILPVLKSRLIEAQRSA